MKSEFNVMVIWTSLVVYSLYCANDVALVTMLERIKFLYFKAVPIIKIIHALNFS